jgi:hypothetical protein
LLENEIPSCVRHLRWTVSPVTIERLDPFFENTFPGQFTLRTSEAHRLQIPHVFSTPLRSDGPSVVPVIRCDAFTSPTPQPTLNNSASSFPSYPTFSTYAHPLLPC